MKIKPYACLLIFVCSVATASAASFDCGLASSKIGKAICANSELSKLDEQMAGAYKHMIDSCNDTSGLIKANQRNWLNNIIEEFKGCVQPEVCINDFYSGRVAYLENMSKLCEPNKSGDKNEIGGLNCDMPKNRNEKAICSNKKALELYKQSASAYRSALAACNDGDVDIVNPVHGLLDMAYAYLGGVIGYLDPIGRDLPRYSGIESLGELEKYCRNTPKESRKLKYEITNASGKYDFVIQMQRYCIPPSGRDDSYTCDAPGWLYVLKKGASVVIQKIPMENISLSFTKKKLLVNSAALYDYQGAINVGDFNFDGQEDFAVQNGNHGSYSGPSYDVFLSADGHFQYSNELSLLIEQSLGFFNIDPKRKVLVTFSKSGCCYHETTQYKVVGNKLVAVVRSIDEISFTDQQGRTTEEHFVNGKWKKTHEESYRPEGYCEEQLDQAAASLRHYVGTSATRVCELLPTDKHLGIVALHYPRDLKNWASPEFGTDVFIAEVETGKVLARYSNPDEFQNAHNMEQSIDTTPYQLTRKLRAFGIRSHFDDVKNGLTYQLMTLYVANGNNLYPILKNVVTRLSNAEWEINRTVQMATNSGNGYADIIVNETSIHKSATENVKVTNPAIKPQKKSYRLVYDGTQYVLPAALITLP